MLSFNFVLVIVLFYLVFDLRGRLHKLESQSKSLGAPKRAAEQQAAAPQHVLSVEEAATPAPAHQAAGPDGFEKLGVWLQEDWLLKLGALLILIGFGWFVSYAFAHNWIGPAGRIVLGILVGTAILIFGSFRIKKYLQQGGIFLVLGSTIILLTVFAARELYHFFTPLTALGIMFLSTAFVAFVSVQYRNRVLSLVSLVLAGIAPLLTASVAPDYIGLFWYLFIVVVGAIWIVVITGHRELTAAALILVALYSAPHLSYQTAQSSTLLLFAYAFAAVFFITNTLGILKLKGDEIVVDLMTAAGNGLFLLAWIMMAAPDEWKSLIISAWMVVFGCGAFMLFLSTKRREPFYAYAGVGIAMLAAATSAELHGATLAIAYTIEAAVISLVAFSVLKDIRVAVRMSFLFIGSIVLSFQSIISPAWAQGIFHKDFFTLLIVGCVMMALGSFYAPIARAANDAEARQNNAGVIIIGSLYLYTLLWLSLHASQVTDDTATMLALVIYTIVGLCVYFYGLRNDRNVLRLYGGIMLGVVVIRLLVVDVWRMALSGRIITFFLVGALLVSTAFISRKKK